MFIIYHIITGGLFLFSLIVIRVIIMIMMIRVIRMINILYY